MEKTVNTGIWNMILEAFKGLYYLHQVEENLQRTFSLQCCKKLGAQAETA